MGIFRHMTSISYFLFMVEVTHDMCCEGDQSKALQEIP